MSGLKHSARVRLGSAPLVAVIVAASSASLTATPTTRSADPVELAAAAGGTARPLQVDPPCKAAVVLFLASDCPVCNSYAPTLSALADSFRSRGVAVYLVYCDPDLKPADVLKHQSDYRLPGTALLDPDGVLARRLGAAVTPEAFVIDAGGAMRYDGPIDDGFAAVGRKRFAATRPYLSDAVAQILAGRPVAVQRVQAVGCELILPDAARRPNRSAR